MFERIAKEIHSIAVFRKYKHVQAGFIAAEEELRPTKKKIPPILSPPVSPERKNKKFGVVVKETKLKKKGEIEGVDKIWKSEESDEEDEVVVEVEAIGCEIIEKKNNYLNNDSKECSFVESSFFSLWNNNLHDTEFFKISIDCYTGLSSTLLKRSNKLAVAIRIIEIKYNIKFSLLDVAQRHEDDFYDLLGSSIEPDRPQNKNKNSNNDENTSKDVFATTTSRRTPSTSCAYQSGKVSLSPTVTSTP